MATLLGFEGLSVPSKATIVCWCHLVRVAA
jgi:hypothetical protein